MRSKRVFLGVSHAFHLKGRAPTFPQFWGSPLFMYTRFDEERRTEFGVVTKCGEVRRVLGQPRQYTVHRVARFVSDSRVSCHRFFGWVLLVYFNYKLIINFFGRC